MSPPVSEYLHVQDIPGAGRGVIASSRIPVGTVIFDSEPPAAHVIFRQYRKEVCAYCFRYDRGRTLPVRDASVGKVFCDVDCQEKWQRNEGDLGVAAWQALQNFAQVNSKAVEDTWSEAPKTEKPDAEDVSKHWTEVAQQVDPLGKQTTKRSNNKNGSSKALKPFMKQINPDILGLFLSGVVFHHRQPEDWKSEVLSLAMDHAPYRSVEDLEAHCNGFVQLHSILPPELQPSCTAELCRVIAEAGSHNAFGIRSGSEDGEEYMGWAIYPSASYFNHSCSPNLLKRRVGSAWEFWTAWELEEGKQCCISYLGGDEKDLTLTERRQRLKEAWEFECMCERCQQEAAE
ncbi:hypothetical protein KC360_g8637 [Hortaea werneckii]|nr:hypothetical protein KC325_g8699 [Hortaea werneckii]KAI6997187.1 hypothetical protein KC359_g3052 [Hortaea werneckii]KAI7140521.1 hypothetical protein KC344_g8663 [Hortaea werneckii]KAI7167465.1 hypothetical protein KC360_g8637 [Hortaea werneckii]